MTDFHLLSPGFFSAPGSETANERSANGRLPASNRPSQKRPPERPGGDAGTERALSLAGTDRDEPIKIADIGYGTGASTLALARMTNALITAVDFLPDVLDVLKSRAEKAGLPRT